MGKTNTPLAFDETHNGGLRVWNRAYAIFCTAFLLLTCVVAVEEMTWPQGSSFAGAVWIAIALCLAARVWRVGVTVHESSIVKHGWFKNREVERQRIQKVRVTPYWGNLSSSYADPRLRMIVLILDDEVLEIPELPGFTDISRKIYRELCTLLQVPFTEPAAPRHAVTHTN